MFKPINDDDDDDDDDDDYDDDDDDDDDDKNTKCVAYKTEIGSKDMDLIHT